MTPETHAAVRAAIADIVEGRSPRSVTLPGHRRKNMENPHQAEIDRIRREHPWIGKMILAFRKDLFEIPALPDEIFRAGDVIPVADSHEWKIAVNLEPVIARYSNADVPLQFPKEFDSRWDSNWVEFGGSATILGFSQNVRNALVRYTSPWPEGAITGTAAPTGMQFFIPAVQLPVMQEAFERKRQFRQALRKNIERINRKEGIQEVSCRGSVIVVGDFVRLWTGDMGPEEVCVMNLDTIVPVDKRTEFDFIEINPSPEGVITPADIHMEGEHVVSRRERGLTFRDLSDWDEQWLPGHTGVARICGFTDDGLMALLEYRGSDFPRDRECDQSIRGLQFFTAVHEMRLRNVGSDWKEILWGRSTNDYEPRVQSLDRMNIYDAREIDKEYKE